MATTAGGAGLLYGYRRAWSSRDAVAGLATAAVVLPQAMAYAAIAGLPVQAGLYCALVPMTVYALAGTSRPLSVSTTSTNSVLTASAVASVAGQADAPTAALTLAVLTGAVLLAAGALRLGFLADFVPLSVITGFRTGLALVIAASQLGAVLGVAVTGDGFLDQVGDAFGQLGRIDWLVFATAAGTVALLLVLRLRPHWPGPLIVVAAAIAVSAAFDLEERGVPVIGSVPGGLPLPRLPDLGLTVALLPAAVGVALIVFLESMTAARVFRERRDPPLRPDRELAVLGSANVASGLFGGYAAAGGMSQTEVNQDAGARSQGAALVTALCAAAALLALSPLLAPLPKASLAGLVLVIAAGLVDLRTFARIARLRHPELVVALAALAGALLLGPLAGLLVAVALALFVVMYQANHPPVYVTTDDDGLLVVRVEAQLYFANAHRVADRVDALAGPGTRVLVLDLDAVPDIDLTASGVIVELHDALARRGVALWFAGLNRRPRRTLRATADQDRLTGEHRLFGRVADAVAHYRSQPIT